MSFALREQLSFGINEPRCETNSLLEHSASSVDSHVQAGIARDFAVFELFIPATTKRDVFAENRVRIFCFGRKSVSSTHS